MDTRHCGYDPCGAVANVLSIPPGEYGRKIKTHRNCIEIYKPSNRLLNRCCMAVVSSCREVLG